jgi:putative thioredoxin
MAPSPWVVDTTAERFEQDVIERSKTVPVVLDFWAPWCAPCRALSPLLERAAEQHAGAFVVVKANTDQISQHAAAFGVQGIPAVFALRDGEVVDGFAGLLSERDLAQWLARILPTAAERLTKEADALAQAQPAAAEEKYRQALAEAPQHAAAKIGLARVLLAQGKKDECRRIVAELESRGFLEPQAQQIKAQLHLAEGSLGGGQLDELRGQVRDQPSDLSLKLKLAEALLASRQFEEGFSHCLEVIEQDAGPRREQARALMVDAFKILGEASPLVLDYRRKLASALY